MSLFRVRLDSFQYLFTYKKSAIPENAETFCPWRMHRHVFDSWSSPKLERYNIKVGSMSWRSAYMIIDERTYLVFDWQ